MYEDSELRERILNAAGEKFMKFGFAKVTMDEIAQDVGISKKTLYKIYSGKEAVLTAVLSKSKCEIDEFVDMIWKNEELDFIAKLSEIMNFIGKHSSKLKEPLMLELRKCCPHIWDDIKEFRREHVMEKFNLLINEGTKAGYFKADLNRELVVLMYLSSIQGIIDPDVLAGSPFSAQEAFQSIIGIMFEGILTKDGRKKWQNRKTE